MKLFNNQSGLRGLFRFIEEIYWATGLSTTPFTEGCAGANTKASPPGRHQEQAPKQRCTFSPTTFSSVQFNARGYLAWTSLGIILFLRSLYSKFSSVATFGSSFIPYHTIRFAIAMTKGTYTHPEGSDLALCAGEKSRLWAGCG